MNIVRMRTTSDCEEAALATAAGVSWEQAHEALGKVNIVPECVSDPLFGNPANMQRAILKLGYKPINRTYGDIISGRAAINKTVVLLHNPKAANTSMHWVVLEGVSSYQVSVHWGDGRVRAFTHKEFLELFTGGKGQGICNAAYELGEIRVSWMQWLLDKIKKIFRKN